MQIIRVDAISNAVQHLQARYQFESSQLINRWLTMRLVNEIFAGGTDLDEIIDNAINDLPANHALAGTKEPKDFDDLRADLRRAGDAIMEKIEDILDHVSVDFDSLLIDDDSPECWIAYHEIDDRTYAVSLRDNQTDPVLLSMFPVDASQLPASDIMHIIDGKVVIDGKVIDPEEI